MKAMNFGRLTSVIMVMVVLFAGCEKVNVCEHEHGSKFSLELDGDIHLVNSYCVPDGYGIVPVAMGLCVKPGDEHYLREHYILSLDCYHHEIELLETMTYKEPVVTVESLDSQASDLSTITPIGEHMIQRGYSEFATFYVGIASYRYSCTFRVKLEFLDSNEVYYTDYYTMTKFNPADIGGYLIYLNPGIGLEDWL